MSRAIRLGTITISDLCMENPDTARRNPDCVWTPPVYTPSDPLTLTAGQQAALLSMHTDTHVRRAVTASLNTRYQPSDFDALRNLDLCEKPAGYRLHKLTDNGRVAAADLEKALCRIHGIHVKRGGNDNLRGRTSYSCSCGGWRVEVVRNIHATANSGISFARHVREARSREVVDVIRTALNPMPKEESA